MPPWTIAKIAAMVGSSPAKGRSFPRSAVTSRPLPRAVRSTRGPALLGGECDLREKPGRLRGEPRERDHCLSVAGFQRAFDPQAAHLEDLPVGPPKGDGRSGGPQVRVERAGAGRRDHDDHIESAQDGKIHPVAGSRHPPSVDLGDQAGCLRGERREERREALQRIRTRSRLLLFGRLRDVDRQVRSVHPDCRETEPAPKKRKEYGRDTHGPDGAMHLPRAGQLQLVNHDVEAREEGEIDSSNRHLAAEGRGGGGLDPLPDRREVDPAGGESQGEDAEEADDAHDACDRHDELPAPRHRHRRCEAILI